MKENNSNNGISLFILNKDINIINPKEIEISSSLEFICEDYSNFNNSNCTGNTQLINEINNNNIRFIEKCSHDFNKIDSTCSFLKYNLKTFNNIYNNFDSNPSTNINSEAYTNNIYSEFSYTNINSDIYTNINSDNYTNNIYSEFSSTNINSDIYTNFNSDIYTNNIYSEFSSSNVNSDINNNYTSVISTIIYSDTYTNIKSDIDTKSISDIHTNINSDIYATYFSDIYSYINNSIYNGSNNKISSTSYINSYSAGQNDILHKLIQIIYQIIILIIFAI